MIRGMQTKMCILKNPFRQQIYISKRSSRLPSSYAACPIIEQDEPDTRIMESKYNLRKRKASLAATPHDTKRCKRATPPAAPTESTSTFPFFRLPRELRDQILDHIWTDKPTPILFAFRNMPLWCWPSHGAEPAPMPLWAAWSWTDLAYGSHETCMFLYKTHDGAASGAAT
jgi:hypothetical protein